MHPSRWQTLLVPLFRFVSWQHLFKHNPPVASRTLPDPLKMPIRGSSVTFLCFYPTPLFFCANMFFQPSAPAALHIFKERLMSMAVERSLTLCCSENTTHTDVHKRGNAWKIFELPLIIMKLVLH